MFPPEKVEDNMSSSLKGRRREHGTNFCQQRQLLQKQSHAGARDVLEHVGADFTNLQQATNQIYNIVGFI